MITLNVGDLNIMSKYIFYDTDISGEKDYDIAGDDYVKLISICCKYSAYLSLRITDSGIFYAKELEITTKHLGRTIKAQTGFTASEWLDRLVVLEAKVLLKSTSMTIQQIAEELNFSSQSFFGKYFKNLVGISPKEFRNS